MSSSSSLVAPVESKGPVGSDAATPLRVIGGLMFAPRGGSAFVARGLTQAIAQRGVAASLVAGSRSDLNDLGDATTFYGTIDLHRVDFTPALASRDPLAYEGPAGTAPMHPSYEDRPGAVDRVFVALSDQEYLRQVRAWANAMRALAIDQADVLHLHHLTPLHAAATAVAPQVPVVTHLHGSELLLLEAIAKRPSPSWPHVDAWQRRFRAWATQSAQLIVAPGNVKRATESLGLGAERFVQLPNGFEPSLFRPMSVDRDAIWRRVLVEDPRRYIPHPPPGSIAYDSDALALLAESTVLVYVGRFTAVKRLGLLLEALVEGEPRFSGPVALVIVGGHPGECEGDHPFDVIRRLGLPNVFLAGWRRQEELPAILNAADALVLPSAREGFGQVILEAMACGIPAVASASLGPSEIIQDGETGWLFETDSKAALVNALVEVVNQPMERYGRGLRASNVAADHYSWSRLGERLEGILNAAMASRPAAPTACASSEHVQRSLQR